MEKPKYKVLEEFSPHDLEKKVEEYIQDGYKPFGNLNLITVGEGKTAFIQVVIKK